MVIIIIVWCCNSIMLIWYILTIIVLFNSHCIRDTLHCKCVKFLKCKNNFNFQITALCLIKMNGERWVLVVCLIIGGGVLFNILSIFGHRMLRQFEEEEKVKKIELELNRIWGANHRKKALKLKFSTEKD